jgi:DUF971 family protein
MTEPTTISADPEHIAISKSRGIKIDWKDGHASDYSCALLRDECPCAVCTGSHGTEPQRTSFSKPDPNATPFQMFKPAPKMVNVEEVGQYAIRIYWNDGHSSGIYSYNHLREICPCPECSARRNPAA